MQTTRQRVAWISDFPVAWFTDLPARVGMIPRDHPRSWQRVLLAQLEAQVGLDLHVIVLKKEIPHSQRFERNGVTFHLLKAPRIPRAPTLFWTDTLIIRRIMRGIRPDVLHAWGSEKGAALVASRLPYPYLVTIQGLMSWYAQIVPLNRYERFVAFLERLSLPKAPLVTTESKFAVEFLGRKFPGVNVAQIEHAPDPSFAGLDRRPQVRPSKLLFVGHFGYRKGADLLLKAFDAVQAEWDCELTVVGNWEEGARGRIEQLLTPASRKRVAFKSGLTPSEIGQELVTATLLVMPTRADTSPNAVKEAAVAGVPVIASRVGGIPDYIAHGENGLLFESGHEDGLVACLREARRHPQFAEGRVDKKRLAWCRDYLSAPRMAKAFLEAYNRVKHR